jgi:hypothetical protein
VVQWSSSPHSGLCTHRAIPVRINWFNSWCTVLLIIDSVSTSDERDRNIFIHGELEMIGRTPGWNETSCRVLSIAVPSKLAEPVTLPTCFLEVTGSNLRRDTGYLEWCLFFLQALQVNVGMIPILEIKPQSLPSKSFPIHYSVIILYSIHCGNKAASLSVSDVECYVIIRKSVEPIFSILPVSIHG